MTSKGVITIFHRVPTFPHRQMGIFNSSSKIQDITLENCFELLDFDVLNRLPSFRGGTLLLVRAMDGKGGSRETEHSKKLSKEV